MGRKDVSILGKSSRRRRVPMGYRIQKAGCRQGCNSKPANIDLLRRHGKNLGGFIFLTTSSPLLPNPPASWQVMRDSVDKRSFLLAGKRDVEQLAILFVLGSIEISSDVYSAWSYRWPCQKKRHKKSQNFV